MSPNTLQDRVALQRAIDRLIAAGAAGVQLRLHDRHGDWTGTAGTARLHHEDEVPADGRFRIGSITKTFVATVMMQLVGEDRIALDDPVDRLLPRFGLDRRITVRMLLQQTSGLFNYTGEPAADGPAEPGIPQAGQEFVDTRFRTWTAEHLIRLALSKPARFAPGSSWAYSNTNYLLAGLLIEKVTGTPYADQVQHRILAPLELSGTTLPGTRSTITGAHAHGYYAYRQQGRKVVTDVTELNPSWAGSAGEILSSTDDLDTFLCALLGGQLLEPRLLTEMLTPHPASGGSAYGLGLTIDEVGPRYGTVFGHSGSIHGYRSFVFATADLGLRLAMSISMGELDGTDKVEAEGFTAAQQDFVTAVISSDE